MVSEFLPVTSVGEARPAVAFACFLMVSLFLTGCETEHDRLMAKKFSSYPTSVKHAIERGYVLYGMTQEQVLLARGEPVCKRTIDHDGRPVEVWLFPPGGPNPCITASYRVYFENGVVSGWKSQHDVPMRHLPRADEEGGAPDQVK